MPAEEDRTAAEAAAEARVKRLLERQARVQALEKEIADREKAVRAKEGAKKQVPLRLSATLWNELAAWAEEDFRSINGQIEFLLTESVRNRKKRGTSGNV
jgi:hypothetical protein